LKKRIREGGPPVLVLILSLFLWEGAVRIFSVPAWLLPAPSAILREGIFGWREYAGHLAATARLSFFGYLIGCLTGAGTAAVLHLVPLLRKSLYPFLIISQNIPLIVLAPLLVIWFGFGVLPKIIVITLVCFFPVAVSTLDGFRQTSPELMHYMEMAGASKGQIFRKLECPHALPFLFSGLKISASYSVMGAVVSEWLGAKEGLGVYMTLAQSAFRTDRVFLSIFLVVFLSLVYFGLIGWLEQKTVKWKPEEREKERR